MVSKMKKKKISCFIYKVQTLPHATPPLGKTHPFRKITVTFEPIQLF